LLKVSHREPPRTTEVTQILTGDALTERVIGLAIVHRQLGPGLLESVYEQCLCFELESAFRANVLVADEVTVELKAVEHLSPIHEAQLLTYLWMTHYRVGLLMNFNSLRLKDGLRRFAV